MQYKKTAVAMVAALTLATAAVSPASAAWRGHGGGAHIGGGWHGGGGWHHGGGWRGAGVGAGIGFAAGAIAGSALAAPYYGGGYGYGYGPYAYDGGYDGDAYAAAPEYSGSGADDAYCAQQYRSYDPASGTFLGYDGARHPCP